MLTYWTCTWLNWAFIAKCTAFRQWGQGVVLHLAEIQVFGQNCAQHSGDFKVIQRSLSNEDDIFSWFCIFCILSIDSPCLGAPEVCSVVQEWFRALWNYCLCLVLPLSVYCSSKWHTSRNRQVFAIPLKYISLTRHHHFSQVLDLLPDSLVHFSRQLLLPKTYSAFSSSSLYILHCGSVDNVILQSFKKHLAQF